MQMRPQAEPKAPPVLKLGLVLTEACGFRCNMCDYWKVEHPKSMDPELIRKVLPIIQGFQLKSVTLTGGEPLMHSGWADVAREFKGIAPIFLCTNGLLVSSNLADISEYVRRIVVSVDGARDATVEAVRGIRRSHRIWDNIKLLRENSSVEIYVKMTIQRQNFMETTEVLDMCIQSKLVDAVGFGMPDMSQVAFKLSSNQSSAYQQEVLLNRDQLTEFSRIVEQIYKNYSWAFKSGFIYEGDLGRYVQRFLCLSDPSIPPPEPRVCHIPKYTLIVYPDGSIGSCYFLPGRSQIDLDSGDNYSSSLMERLVNNSQFDSQVNSYCLRCDQLLFDVVNSHRARSS